MKTKCLIGLCVSLLIILTSIACSQTNDPNHIRHATGIESQVNDM